MLGSAQNCSPEQLGQRLPHTRAWLAAASGQLAHVEQLEAVLANQTSTAPVEQVPALPQMRSGLRASAASSGSTTATMQPLTPCQARTWRGLVRLGLVQLVSGTTSSWQSRVLERVDQQLAWLTAVRTFQFISASESSLAAAVL